jgi:magnesium-transporting ATPase (P-type)
VQKGSMDTEASPTSHDILPPSPATSSADDRHFDQVDASNTTPRNSVPPPKSAIYRPRYRLRHPPPSRNSSGSIDNGRHANPHETIPFATEATYLSQELETSLANGLSETDARHRPTTQGPNSLNHYQQDTLPSLLWKQVSNTMTVVLVIALVIAFAIKDYPDGGVISGIPHL